ncbi:MAG: ribonuclease D [Coriobacteriia bacterium]
MPEGEESVLITTRAQLREFVSSLSGRDAVAVDTEFMREKTYWPRLCLVQISDGESHAAVDPFEVGDLSPLLDIFRAPGTVKVFHAGQQDMEIFHHVLGEVPAPVFDTQVAAALASFPLQAGYGMLVSELLGVELDKMHSYTDWSKRPLAPRQIEYALADVKYLLGVYRILRERLERAGRLEWLRRDFEEMADPETYEVHPEEMYRRVKRRTRLNRRQMAVLRELAAWREREAMKRDVPRQRVVGDEALVQMAARAPKSVDEIAATRGVNDGIVRSCGTDILAAVERGMSLPESELPHTPRRPRSRMDIDAMTDLMSALVKVRAEEYGIAGPVLASRKEMTDLAGGELEDSPLLSGWRKEHIGDDLLDLLGGRLHLAVEDGRVVVRKGAGTAAGDGGE